MSIHVYGSINVILITPTLTRPISLGYTCILVNMVSSSCSDGGWLLEEVYDLCRKDKKEIVKWLRREQVVGDFADYDCPNDCNTGKFRLVKDSSCSKNGVVSNRKCNKVSVRKGSWF
jgi:hypothetical protein